MRLGKDRQAILLAVFLLFSASAGGQAGTSFKYQLDGKLPQCDITTAGNSIVINYSISELNIENFSNETGAFYRISIPGHTQSGIIGKPELPVLTRLINTSEGSSYKITITDITSSRINPAQKKFKGNLYPAQEGETKTLSQGKRVFSIDKKVYATRGIIASDTVRIEFLGKVRNRELGNLVITPVRYNPKTNVLEVITSMKIEITFLYSEVPGSKSLSRESELFSKSLDKAIHNYNPEGTIPGYTDQPVKMVIITDTAFRKALTPFYNWKTRKGFKLIILYKGAEFAGDSYAQLKDTLSKIYNSATVTDPPPEYLLIIGDVDHIPKSDETSNLSDMYYGEFDGGGDYFPEMYIGRLPVADTNDVKSVVNKIVQYENFAFADTNKFYQRALVSAGYDAAYATNMNGQVNYSISDYLNSANNIDSYHFFYPESGGVKVEDSIKKIFKKGISFLNYTGHGEAAGWLDPAIKSKDVDSLKNKNMYPFVISNACRTAQYNTATSLGNKMVLAKEKGAIGFIGCSNDSYWDEDYFWAVGAGAITAYPEYENTGLGAYDRFFHTHGELPSDWYFTMGQINYAGNLAVSSSTSSRKKYYWETYNLIGDPSVIPIIGKPVAFNVSIPDTLPNGIRLLTLNAVPFSYIAVSHSDTLWDASYVSASGSVELELPGVSDDSCLIVITGQNRIPLFKKIFFSDIKNEFISLTSSSINDSEGNNNKRADFGESFFLKIAVSNLGLTNATNVYAKISSLSDIVTINNDSVFIGTLAAHSERILSTDLKMTLAGNVPDMSIITFDLTLKDLKSEKHYTIDVSVHAPDLQIISCTICDTVSGNKNTIADPGETFQLVFKVINKGSSDVSGQLYLSSPSSDLEVLEPSTKSGTLKFGGTFDIPVTVRLKETVPVGSFITISSLLDCTPFLIPEDFTFRVGRVRESFESGSFKVFPWINISPIPWIITQGSSCDGTISARSGVISSNGMSTLAIKTTYEADDSVKFFYKVSSESNYDNFTFRLNDIEILRKSGEIPWTKTAIAVPGGLNKMEWIYSKDQSVSNGSDCAWIDMIDFSGSGSVNYIQKDLNIARIINPLQKDKLGLETITVKVVNTGQEEINGFNMAYKLNDQSDPVTEFFDRSLKVDGDSAIIEFKVKADLSKFGVYNILAYGFDNNDDYPLNDTSAIRIENMELRDSISIFPNPSTDRFSISLESGAEDLLLISIFSNTGVKLYEIKQWVYKGRNTIEISDPALPPAVYYLNIHGMATQRTIPFIKLKK